jgi:hypothetical protein
MNDPTADDLKDFVAHFPGSVRELAVWIRVESLRLRELDDAFARAATGLAVARGRIGNLRTSDAGHRAAVDETRAAVRSWRTRVGRSADLLDEYLVSISVDPGGVLKLT